MPKPINLLLVILFFFMMISCGRYQTIRYNTYRIATVDNNVCKKLSGHVVLYAIFVDARYPKPWSEYDITSTLDSIHKAARWLEKLAKAENIPLTIEVKYHQNGKTVPIVNNLPDKTLSGTLFSPVPAIGVPKLDRWSDRIARTAGLSFPKDTSKFVKTPNRISDRERLIARLRDLHKTDKVALMYFVNDYYSQDISLALHTAINSSPEYAIVSYKKPAVITHEFLHLFGALDLYISPFDKKKRSIKKKAEIMKLFPNEVMAFAFRDLDSLNISPFTKYLIGWDNELDETIRKKILGKVKIVKY